MSKFKNIKLLLCFLLQAATANVFAQHNPILDNFTVFENNGKVYLNWAIISGSTCNGIQIFRSTDSINFTQVGSIAGICGNSSKAVSYNFTVNNPEKNKINYYRLELGNNGSSEILSVEIIDIESGYQIRPNPVIGKVKIYFDNNTEFQHRLFIYNLNGIQIFSSTTKEDFFELNTETFLSGIYLFTISTKGNLPKATGKLMVQ